MKDIPSLRAGLTAVLLLFSFSPLAAADKDDPATAADAAHAQNSRSAWDEWTTGKYLLGDFGGARTRLVEHGVDFFAFFTSDIAGNPVGGKNPDNITYTDDVFFGVNVYFEKLFGWKGARFYLNGIRRNGHSLTNRYVGSIYNAQQDYGGQNIFLYDVDFEQYLFDEKVSVKLGRFSASDDFNNSYIYNLYMNNGIDGDIRNVLFGTQFSAYPFNTWGGRAVYYPVDDVSIKLGVFQTTAEVFNRERNGVDWSIRGDDGVFLIGQVNWAPVFAKTAGGEIIHGTVASADRDPKKVGLPGHYNFGGSFSPWKGFTRFGDGRRRADSYGFFTHMDQMVYREKPGSDQGLVLWAAGAVYPQGDISIVPYQGEGGFVYQGLLPARDNDKLLLGLIYGKFSDDFARTVQRVGGGRPDYEFVVEAAYRFQLTPFFFIQPDLQYTHNIFGTGIFPDAVVVGTHTGIVF